MGLQQHSIMDPIDGSILSTFDGSIDGVLAMDAPSMNPSFERLLDSLMGTSNGPINGVC